jgi:hypothetical protein
MMAFVPQTSRSQVYRHPLTLNTSKTNATGYFSKVIEYIAIIWLDLTTLHTISGDLKMSLILTRLTMTSCSSLKKTPPRMARAIDFCTPGFLGSTTLTLSTQARVRLTMEREKSSFYGLDGSNTLAIGPWLGGIAVLIYFTSPLLRVMMPSGLSILATSCGVVTSSQPLRVEGSTLIEWESLIVLATPTTGVITMSTGTIIFVFRS